MNRLGTADFQAIHEAITTDLGITPADLAERFPSATGRSTFVSRTQSARVHLTRAGLLEANGQRRYRVTTRGQAVLAESPTQIDRAYLRRFPEYSEWELTANGPDHGVDICLSSDSTRA